MMVFCIRERGVTQGLRPFSGELSVGPKSSGLQGCAGGGRDSSGELGYRR